MINGLDQTKDVNSSLILGRKIDSPQLRVGKDLSDRPLSGAQGNLANALNRIEVSTKQQHLNLKRDDLLGMNFQTNQLNQTNKEIQKKQFDFNFKQPKANVTIQFDTTNPHPKRGDHSNTRHQKKNNQSQNRDKKKQQAQKQQSQVVGQGIQIVNNYAQPLINLQIKNVKIQPKKDKEKTKELKYAAGNTSLVQKHANYHGKHRKNKSEVKYSQKGQSKSSMVNKTYKQRTKPEEQHQEVLHDNYIFNFENKENESLNVNQRKQLTPTYNTTHHHHHNQHDMSISSISSGSHKGGINASGFSNKYSKKYFMDKSSLLKALSPDKQSTVNQTAILNGKNLQQQLISQPLQISSFADNEITAQNLNRDLKSNQSTINQITSQQPQHMKIKRPATAGNNPPKLNIKAGVDKIIKENLRKIKNKEEEDLIKRYLEDYRQKQKKVEISQRNQEVRKINASRIQAHHQHKNSQVNQALAFQKINYKKQRSKSCMNKTDNIFSNLHKREKLIQQQAVVPEEKEKEKKERKREKSFVLEIKELKKEIDEEIRREILEGKLDVGSATNKRTNMTTLNAKPFKNKDINQSLIEGGVRTNQKSREDLIFNQKPKRKSKSRESKVISQNIQRFIERKKKAQNARKSMEQTLEQEKQLKIKANLHNLNKFVKQHFRHQSHGGFFLKKLNQPNGKVDQSGIIKKIKPQFFKKPKKQQMDESKFFSLQDENIFDKQFDPREGDYLSTSQNISPSKQLEMIRQLNKQNDNSQEFYDEYSRILNSVKKHQDHEQKKKIKSKKPKNYESVSVDGSPNKQKISKIKKQNGQKQLKMKFKIPVANNQSNLLDKNRTRTQLETRMLNNLEESYSDQRNQNTVIKNDLVPRVPEDQQPSLIPPQSDIASLDKSNIIHREIIDNRYQDKRQLNSKSPSSIERQRKIKVFINKYSKSSDSETKALIKLHSAAIIIQQNFRIYLSKRGYYRDDLESNIYIDSEQEQEEEKVFNEYQVKVNKSKNGYEPTKMSPLRVKNLDKKELQNMKDNNAKQQKASTEFYGDDSSDLEKVVMCSVISSGRPEEESLQNTQKYVPFRTKNKQVKEQIQLIPKIQSGSQELKKSFTPPLPLTNQTITQKQPQKQMQINVGNDGLSKEQQQVISDSSSGRPKVPGLDLNKLQQVKLQHTNQQSSDVISNDHHKESSNRSVFERNPFQDFVSKVHSEDFNLNAYPEMLRLREDAIKYKEQAESKYITKMYKSKQFSPRTYEQKRKELEHWVSKEQEEVKKTKKVFEEQWQKTTKMIEDTQKDQDIIKKYLIDSSRISVHSKRGGHNGEIIEINPAQIQSHRLMSSRRDQPTILDMIYDEKSRANTEEDELDKQQQRIELERLKIQREREQLEEEERQRKLKQKKDEEDRQRKLKQQRDEEEKKKQDELEEKKKKQKENEEKERIRKNQEQQELENLKRQKEKDEMQRKEIERKKREEELQKQREEVERRRKEDEEIKRKLDEENRQKQLLEKQKQEEIERQRNKRDQEEKDKREKLQKEKEKQEQIQREQEDAKKKKTEEKEKERKERERMFEELQRKMDAKSQKLQEQKQSSPLKDNFFVDTDLSHDQDSDHKVNSRYQNQFVADDLQSEPDFGAANVSPTDSYDYQDKKLLEEVLSVPHAPSMLKRTSGDTITDEEKEQFRVSRAGDNLLSKEENKLNKTMSLQDLNYRGTNEESKDSDQMIKPDDEIYKPDYFTRNYDTDKPEEFNKTTLLDKVMQPSSSEEIKFSDHQEQVISPKSQSQVKTIGIKSQLETSQKQILILDHGKEVNQEPSHPVNTFQQYPVTKEEERKRHRIPDGMIPVESENIISGVPVSPASNDDNQDIQTGSKSLESTLSDDKAIKKINYEINNQQIPQATSPQLSTQSYQLEEKEEVVSEITDDIYNALMAELKIELDLLLGRRLFNFDDESQPKQSQNQNNNYILSESGRILIFERKGIRTDLFAIEAYVEEVLEEILRDKTRFLHNINLPLTKKALEVLNQLQNSEIGSYEHFETNFPPVIQLDLYLKLEKRRKEARERDRESNNPGINASGGNVDKNFLAECEHIHNKVLFDCINDSLLQFKPYGKDGVPLPWSRQGRRLKPIEDFTIEEMFEIVKHDLFRWAIMQAGTLPRKEFVFGGVFDDELFAEIREKKLATLLAREMIENEPKWLNYEFEEAQVKIDIGDMILEQLVTETIQILNSNKMSNDQLMKQAVALLGSVNVQYSSTE